MTDPIKPPIVRGGVFFYTQRVDAPEPFVNCMFYSLASVLRFMGYDVPKDYGMTLRKASGVPLVDPNTGRHLGTSIADTKRALTKILPTATLIYAAWTNNDLWNVLPQVNRKNRGKMLVRVALRMQAMPRRLRRWVGYDWVGQHAMTIAWKRVCNGESGGAHAEHRERQEVWLMDPMGRPSRDYSGEWVSLLEISPAFVRNSEGAIRVTAGVKNTAI